MCAHLRAGFLQSYQHPPLREFMLCRSRQILYSHPRNIGGFTVEANMPLAIAPHFNQGTLPVAFVFSVPGAAELAERRPVAGDTGMNLTLALRSLVVNEPRLFRSLDRYAYRITNAFDSPMAKSLKSGASEAKAAQILDASNIKRVIKEVQDCEVVVLCGRKAQLLTNEVARTSVTVVHAWHLGNRALIGKYNGEEVRSAPTAAVRRELRVAQWAEELVWAIRANAHTKM